MRYSLKLHLKAACLCTFAFCLLTATLGKAHAGKLEIAELGACPLENDQVILDCKLGYRVYGKRAADDSNIILMPTWYNGSAEDLARYGYLGSGGLVDTDKYHVIAVNAFGNGVSSSPSNSPQSPFPRFSIRDMVAAQHRLLTEHLGIEHLHAVVGASMGGHQTYEWMMMFPGFANHFIPIEGSPWPTYYDYVKERAWLSALERPLDNPSAIQQVSELLNAIDTLLYWTPAYVNREFGQGDFETQFESTRRAYDEDSLRDRASQTLAILSHDIRRNRKELESMLAETGPVSALAVVFTRDMTVIPQPNRLLAEQFPLDILEIDGDCGHFGPNPECYQAQVAPAVNNFLKWGTRHPMLHRVITVDGIEREYFVYRPDGHGENDLPVIFALHGYGSTATGFASAYALNEHAEKNGYMIVYPQGAGFISGGSDEGDEPAYLVTSWNDKASNFTPTPSGPHCTSDRLEYPCPPECGSCNHCSWVSCHDDTRFILQMIDDVEREFATNTDRYYLLGNSNGGTMAQRLGCDFSDRFAAVGIGITQMPPGHTCGPKTSLPMLHLYGGQDDVIGHDGTPTSDGWIFTSAEQNSLDWATGMGCADKATAWRTAVTEKHGLICKAYTRCPVPGQEVVSCQDPEAGHEWRGQRIPEIPASCVTLQQYKSFPQQPLCPGSMAQDTLWGMDVFWQFFQRYTRGA